MWTVRKSFGKLNTRNQLILYTWEKNAMQLKNVLIVVDDIERSKKFYKDIFGLEVILDNEGNVILTGGLVLQDATIWAEFVENLVIPHNNASELYFEENKNF